jgi:acetolactate synthase-1/2/3 large subunit
MRLADYVAQRCVEAGARHTFLVTGGGAMHLNDAFGRHPDMSTVCFHHEQGAAIAAESYYRINNQLCVLNVTTGPGGINALNGVFGAYVDSCGMLVVSGQVKNETYLRNYNIPLRQLGDQEVDIVSMARPVVKYAVTLQDPKEIREVMDKAIFLATNGRPGPVWIDIPVDMQGAKIAPELLKGWDEDEYNLASLDPGVTENTKLELQKLGVDDLEFDVGTVVEKLLAAKRPVVYAGTGVRLSNSHQAFLQLVERLQIPVVTSFNAYDTLTNDHPLYAGHPGMVGDRAGNFAVQNSDFVLILGSRLNIRMISYNYKNFASRAYKVMVDIDRAELEKPTLNIDLKVHMDLKHFISEMLGHTWNYAVPEAHTRYLVWCRERVTKYDPVLPEYQHRADSVNPYLFFEDFFDKLDNDAVVVCGNGSASVISGQAGKLKQGQRFYSNSGNASMGYDLPAAIGACIAAKKKVYCIAGDGSIMMNLQELSTVVGYQFPVKIIIVNNNGYHSIKQTQRAYFSDNVFGTSPQDGVALPDFVALGVALGIMSHRVCTMDAWNSELVQMLLRSDLPAIIEVVVDPEQMFAPKLAARKLEDGSLLAPSLEYMSPFLPDAEMEQNIIKD